MEHFKDDLNWDFVAKKSFRVIIVGAGIAGLAAGIGLRRAGHDVVILEQVPHIGEVGAGIQIAPNAARILGRFGVLEKIMECGNVMKECSSRRWHSNEEIGTAPLMPEIGEKYKAPLSVIHRGDLQRILLELIYAEKVDVRLKQKVIKADPAFKARVQVQSGEWLEGDAVIAADGIKSDIRRQMVLSHGIQDKSTSTGDAAYRVLIPREKMQGNMRALRLLESNIGMRWMGPGGHIMAYPIKNNNVYNMVLLHPQKPDGENTESWTNKGDKEEMMDFYKGWNDLVRDLLSYVPEGEINEWTLNLHHPLSHWTENECALIGDSCHPMLPYVAQGAAQAIEDAAVLTISLSLAEDVPTALGIYEAVRKSRAESIQNSAATTRHVLHLPDGPEQEKRDKAIAGTGPNPDLWGDQKWQDYMWGVDVMKDTLYNWDQWVAQVQGKHSGCVNGGVMDNLSIECTELESPTTEANSPDPVLESYYLQQLQQQYADPSQALAPHGGAELDTTHEAASEKAQCERVEEYDFRLFTRPSALGPASVGTGNGPQRVTLSSPSPVGDALGLTSRGRPDEYYFSGATSPELAEQYTRAAVSGQEIMEGLKMRWRGAESPWRVTVLKATEPGKMVGLEHQSQAQTNRRKRCGKKKRIVVRRRSEARAVKEVAARQDHAEKEAAEREKRTRRNREKKVKKKQKDQLKKKNDLQDSG